MFSRRQPEWSFRGAKLSNATRFQHPPELLYKSEKQAVYRRGYTDAFGCAVGRDEVAGRFPIRSTQTRIGLQPEAGRKERPGNSQGVGTSRGDGQYRQGSSLL